jgi:hypothetical protein
MGTEEFWVPFALAAVSGGAQYANAQNATSRANNAEAQSIADQQQYRTQANGMVNQLTKAVANNSPNQLADQAQTSFVNTLRKNAAGSALGGGTSSDPTLFGASTSALPPSTVGSSQYKNALANSQKQVEQYGNTNAGEMSAVDAAVRQRQNEGLAMQTLATNLNGLNQQSYQKNFVDQLRAQMAGQESPWVSLFSGLAGNAGNTISKNGLPWGGTSTPASYTFGGAGATPSGYTNQNGYLVNSPGQQ